MIAAALLGLVTICDVHQSLTERGYKVNLPIATCRTATEADLIEAARQIGFTVTSAKPAKSVTADLLDSFVQYTDRIMGRDRWSRVKPPPGPPFDPKSKGKKKGRHKTHDGSGW